MRALRILWRAFGFAGHLIAANARGIMIAALSMASCSLGLGCYALYADFSYGEAQSGTVEAVTQGLRAETELYASVPEFSPQYSDALIGLADEGLGDLNVKIRHKVGPRDLALTDEVKLVKVRAQKRRVSGDIAEVRFRAGE